ncbi:hypothetical protein [Antrihabitans cavernicola]|uniref:DUF4386 domain-containing protein n=1 Tax=Antrihabitans cavernicola TaxID=2495913 RepID=A0A5A7SFA8_9NOCA|nr:hypothetical protein [Spelaeibacter cavernicola]KAA0024808.1 hypothetical protein FOY51_02425 [Spelaeibacter cavernicola]
MTADTRDRNVTAMAAVGFALSWAVGLTVFSSSTSVRSTGAAVIDTFAVHQDPAIVQYVFTEGIPAITLAVVVFGLARFANMTDRLRLILTTCGLGAAAVSSVECALGIHLVGWVVPRADDDAAGMLFDAINRLDGVKMILLAAAAGVTVMLARDGALPRWMLLPAIALVVTILISGVGYLFLLSGPAVFAWASLPLLIMWVLSTGFVLRKSHVSPAMADYTA